jgi:hypothetical protein
MTGNDGYYEALWPRSPRRARVKPLAKRLDTLAGKTVAQVWDHAVERVPDTYSLE